MPSDIPDRMPTREQVMAVHDQEVSFRCTSLSWQRAFDVAWAKHECLHAGTTEQAARAWYTKGRVAQDIAIEKEMEG